jgi:N-acetylmuramoyl-L-alanine amidase
MPKVGIGVGHGGKDPGATGNGLRESDINLIVAFAMNDELKRHGVETYMTRTADEDDPLTDEIWEINAFNPDVAVDIHTNAGGGDGFEAFHSKATNGLGKHLAELIEAEVVAIGQNSRGVKMKLNSSGKDYYGFIRETYCPAVIVEGAFIDNAEDIRFIDTVEEQRALGVTYAKGVLKYFGIDWTPAEDYKRLYDKAMRRLNEIYRIAEVAAEWEA